jgi:hypothetical protein
VVVSLAHWMIALSIVLPLACGCTQAPPSPAQDPLTDAGGPKVAPAVREPPQQPIASASVSASVSADANSECPQGMVLVAGKYCPDVRQTCLKWMDPPGPYEFFRCAEYAKPVCASADNEKISMRFCIDRDEYTPPGEKLPASHHSWTTAKQVCESQGKRLCLESEWQFACEGEEMRPYPYGFKRDVTACNIDRTDLGKPNEGLRDLREPAGSHPKCVSPFGVRDMSGNVEEWATLDHPVDPKDRSTMKGAWWLPGRNGCRAATTGHGENYAGPQVGVRCCK